MLGYLLLLVFLLLLDASKIERNKKLFIFSLFLIVFTGIRYRIGYDYHSYVTSIENEWYSFEVIPALFQYIAHYTDSSVFFILSSIFIYTFYFLGINKASNDKLGSVFFFIGFPFLYFSSLSTVRQSMALAVIFYLICLNKPSIKKKIFLILIAFLSHRSALICILLLIPWKKMSHFSMVIMFIVSLLIGSSITTIITHLSFDNILFIQFSKYLENVEDFEGGSKTKIIIYLITIIILFSAKRLIRYNPKMRYYIALISLGASLYALFSINPHVAERFCIFFWGSTLLVIPTLTRMFKIPRLIYYLFCIMLFSYSIYVGHITSINQKQYQHSVYYPYRTILFK